MRFQTFKVDLLPSVQDVHRPASVLVNLFVEHTDKKPRRSRQGCRLWPVLRGRTLVFVSAEPGACFCAPSHGSLGDVLIRDRHKRRVWERTVKQTRGIGT